MDMAALPQRLWLVDTKTVGGRLARRGCLWNSSAHPDTLLSTQVTSDRKESMADFLGAARRRSTRAAIMRVQALHPSGKARTQSCKNKGKKKRPGRRWNR